MPPNLDHSSLARQGAGLFSSYPDTELIYFHLTTCSDLSWSLTCIYMFKIVLEWIFILFKRVKKGRHFFFFFFNYFYPLYSKIIIKRYPKLSTFLFMECPKPELTITNMRLLQGLYQLRT